MNNLDSKKALSDKITDKVDKSDKVIKYGVISILIILILASSVVISLFFIQAERTREAATLLHYRTQRYVRCVAEVLVLPLAQRDESVIDNCTKEADAITKLPN